MRAVARCLLLLLLVSAIWGQRKPAERPVRLPVRGMRGAVTGGTDFATDAGMRMYYAGGNAVDAGVAAMFAASICEFSHFGFGGEAPILIRTKTGKVVSIAGVGTMPKSASADFFRNRRLQPGEVLNLEANGLKNFVPVAGLMPALVPGMVDAALLALRDYGTKPFHEAIAAAIELADGMPLDETRAGSIRSMRRFAEMWPATKATFFPEGRAPAAGEIFRQPNLAATLRAMAAAEKKALAAGKTRAAAIDAVRDYFYRGEIARKIDEFSKANGGLLRYEDLAAFRLEPEEAHSVNYRGYVVYKPGFWSQGPSLLQTLRMLEASDLTAMGVNSTEYIHTVVEALKLAYADRDTYYGDPKFVHVPGDVLLSESYAAERRKQLSLRASMEFRPGAIGGKTGRHPAHDDIVRMKIDDELMARDTTCVNAIDQDGIAFSATPSGAWTPPVIAGSTGIPLTQRAQSFLLVRGHPNELAGGKRPRVTLSPTLVTYGGKAYLALSTPGGDNQDQALLQVLLNVIEFGMNPQQAIEAPRFQTRHLVSSFDNHAMNPGDLLLDDRISPLVSAELAARGHKVEPRTRWGSGSAPTMIRLGAGGVIEAGADPFMFRSARAW
jgi:gamma-glutamyltranspeptidase/glutathione hydrolase